MRNYLVLTDDKMLPSEYDNYIIFNDRFLNAMKCCRENGKRYEFYGDNWTSKEKAKHALDYLSCIREAVLDHAVKILNDYQNACYSRSAWHIMLRPWLDIFLPSYYDKYLKLRTFRENNIVCDAYIYDTKKPVTYLDYYDYLRLGFDKDDFHKYQFSLLAHEIDTVGNIHFFIKGKYAQPSVFYRDLGEQPHYIKDFFKERREYKERHNIYDDVTIQSDYIKWNLYREIMEQKPYKITGYFLEYFETVRKMLKIRQDEAWRCADAEEEEEGEGENDEFLRIVLKLLRKELPAVYVETFKQLRKVARDNYKYGYKAKALVYDASGVIDNEMHKIFLMEMEGRGAKKIDIQHGGSYGMETDPAKEGEYGVCDIFFTSGWEREKNGVFFRKMPFVKFFRMEKYKTNIASKYILYVNYTTSKNSFRIQSLDTDVSGYMDDELKFLSLIDTKTKENLHVRLYEYFGWNRKEVLVSNVDGLIFDEENDFYNSLAMCSLCVTEFFSTTTMEALYLDKPVLVLEHPAKRAVYKEDVLTQEIEELVDVGIIACTPENLANTLNVVHDDIDAWWNESKRQAAIKKIKEKYVYFPTNARELWIEEIASYAE